MRCTGRLIVMTLPRSSLTEIGCAAREVATKKAAAPIRRALMHARAALIGISGKRWRPVTGHRSRVRSDEASLHVLQQPRAGLAQAAGEHGYELDQDLRPEARMIEDDLRHIVAMEHRDRRA